MNNIVKEKVQVRALVDVYYQDSEADSRGNEINKTFKKSKGDTFYVSKSVYELLIILSKDKNGKEIPNSARVELVIENTKEEPTTVVNDNLEPNVEPVEDPETDNTAEQEVLEDKEEPTTEVETNTTPRNSRNRNNR